MSGLIIGNIGRLVTPEGITAHHGKDMNNVRVYKNATVYTEDGIITDIKENDIKAERYDGEYIDAGGKCAIPGFIDPHTHLLFGGSRPDEFLDRLAGVPYLELLERGGGIVSTMRATRSAGEYELYSTAANTLKSMLKLGVTTVEIKSGYGLDKETEIKMLHIAKKLSEEFPITVKRTFLGAHAVPPEYAGNSTAYIKYIIDDVLPEIADEGLADFCDVFCETGVFTIEESRELLNVAKTMGMKAKIHADEIYSTGGAGLAAELGAVSADHLLAISDNDISSMAKSDTVAVLLPATAFCMRKNFAPARKMIDSGCAVALASDYNPGSCYTYSVPLVMALAVIGMHMSMNEVLTAMTLNAAAALDSADSCGSIEIGKKADILLLKEDRPEFLVYQTGINQVEHVIQNGEFLF